jgi:hypothetical protein
MKLRLDIFVGDIILLDLTFQVSTGFASCASVSVLELRRVSFRLVSCTLLEFTGI